MKTRNFKTCWWECKNGATTVGKVWQFFKKLNTEITMNLHSTSRYIVQRTENKDSNRSLYTSVHWCGINQENETKGRNKIQVFNNRWRIN